MTVYKINEAIKVRFQALGGQTGITDLQLVATNPSGVDGSPITLTELSNGLYETSFTPNVTGRWFIKITSATLPENGASESYYVGEQNADYNIITGTTGNKLNIDSEGRISVVTTGSSTSIPTQIKFETAFVAINVGEWQDVLDYTVPTGYRFNAIKFEGYSQTTNEAIRAIVERSGGTFNSVTNTFTDGLSYTAPQFASSMEILITSATGAGNDTFTITYTNHLGVTGRTGTVTVPKNSVIGTRMVVTLQTGDYGILDITNITHNQLGQAAAYTFYFISEFFYLLMPASNTQYRTDSLASGCLIFNAGDIISLHFLATSKISYIRRLNLCGFLTSGI